MKLIKRYDINGVFCIMFVFYLVPLKVEEQQMHVINALVYTVVIVSEFPNVLVGSLIRAAVGGIGNVYCCI